MLKSLALYSFFIIISLGFFTISSRVIKSEEGVQDDYRHTGGGGPNMVAEENRWRKYVKPYQIILMQRCFTAYSPIAHNADFMLIINGIQILI